MVHNLINTKLYPSVHFWVTNNRVSIMSNQQIVVNDTLKLEGKSYLVTTLFPDEEQDGGKAQKRFENATNSLVYSDEHKYITNKSKYFEYVIC